MTIHNSFLSIENKYDLLRSFRKILTLNEIHKQVIFSLSIIKLMIILIIHNATTRLNMISNVAGCLQRNWLAGPVLFGPDQQGVVNCS